MQSDGINADASAYMRAASGLDADYETIAQ